MRNFQLYILERINIRRINNMINLGEKIEQEYSIGEFLVENQEKLKRNKEAK